MHGNARIHRALIASVCLATLVVAGCSSAVSQDGPSREAASASLLQPAQSPAGETPSATIAAEDPQGATLGRVGITITNGLAFPVQITAYVEPNAGWPDGRPSPQDAPPAGFNGLTLEPGASATSDFVVPFNWGGRVDISTAFTIVIRGRKLVMAAVPFERVELVPAYAHLGQEGWQIKDRYESRYACLSSAELPGVQPVGQEQGTVSVACTRESTVSVTHVLLKPPKSGTS